MIQWGKNVANSNNAKVVTFTFPVPFAASPIIASMAQCLAALLARGAIPLLMKLI